MNTLLLGKLFFTFIFTVNVATFALYAIDKIRAIYHQWRIPEALLLGLAVIGGAYGAGAGMLLFRHKTLHRTFRIVVPLFFVIWFVILTLVCLAL
ncbi:MAG: DUF1294 domain-containing protein [Coprobacter sp.]|nr:DUF1294 domain-containing protein [Coprobacter sp.]